MSLNRRRVRAAVNDHLARGSAAGGRFASNRCRSSDRCIGVQMRAGFWGRGSALLVISAGVLALDIITGPFIQFPITFVVPVGLGAWYLGRTAGVGFAVVLVGCRLAIAIGIEASASPIWSALVNAGIRLVVLVALAVLLDQVAWQRGTLAARVELLEGILPICVFCKKIRRADGDWEQVESYISSRSSAQFSHGFCEVCAHEQYPEFLTASGGIDRVRPGSST